MPARLCSVQYRLQHSERSEPLYSAGQISAAIYRLRMEASNNSRSLYANNQAVYNLLRYGVGMKVVAGKVTETVHLTA